MSANAGARTSAPILQELRHGTQDLHREIEGVLPFFREDFNATTYLAILKSFWSFYQPFEKALQEALLKSGMVLSYEERQKSPSLLKDLRTFLSADEIATLSEASLNLPLLSPAAIYGCLYVIEGSTLGGQVITPHLMKAGIPSEATHFFSGYGPQTGKMWKSFQTLLIRDVQTPAQIAEAVASARATFLALKVELSRS